MSKKEKIFTLITNILAFILFLIVLIPYGKSSMNDNELLVKCLIAPIAACVLFAINSYIKYVIGSNAYKYTTFSAYLPVFLYLVGILGFAAIVMLRTGAGSVYDVESWIPLTFVFVAAAVIFAVISIFIGRFIILINTKENIFLDISIFVIIIAVTAVLKAFFAKHVGVAMESDMLQSIGIPAMIGFAVVVFLVFVMLNYLNYNEKFVYASRKELLTKWYEGREAVYRQAELDILYNLYDFSKNELGIEEIVVVEDDEEAIQENEAEQMPETVTEPVEEVVEDVQEVQEEVVEEVIEQPVEEVTQVVEEEIDPTLLAQADEKISELLKLKEELTAVEEVVEEEIKSVLPPKEFKPSFADMIKYAKSLKGVTFQGNEQGTNYKFLLGKKVFLILNDTPRDYRLTFLMDLPKAAEYAQILAFSKAKSPKGAYSFKLVSKGEFDEETIKGIIKGSYEMVDIIKDREIAAKEALKAQKAEERLQAKLAEMTEEQRVKYLARLEKKRELEAMTPEERAAKEEAEARAKEEAKAAKAAEAEAKALEKERLAKEKEEAKAAEAEAKALEKERLAKEKEEAKAAEAEAKALEKERLAKEKEEAKAAEAEAKALEKERLAKEKEEARLAAEKQKEKEKLAAQKAKEKEKAKLAAQKQKEKEKLAAQKAKEKEKEKLAAQKAKEKEQARLAAEKQKEKEKLAAQKAKEKEKAKLAAQKQKEKEKLAAQKAKEKEKEKLAAQKAKEQEKAA